MLKREQELRRNIVEILCMEDRIPKDHLLRKIDAAVDFCHIYDLVGDYAKTMGVPALTPLCCLSACCFSICTAFPRCVEPWRRSI